MNTTRHDTSAEYYSALFIILRFCARSRVLFYRVRTRVRGWPFRLATAAGRVVFYSIETLPRELSCLTDIFVSKYTGTAASIYGRGGEVCVSS